MIECPDSNVLYTLVPTKRYRKHLKRLASSGKSIEKLNVALRKISRGEKLEESYKDHELQGKFRGKRVCHIGPDWLLMYEKEKDKLIIVLFATGTHRDVLGIE